MARWKAFDLTWGRSIYYCTECKEGIEVPTSCGKPMYKFCPMCGARMDTADTPQTDCDTCKYGQDKHRYAHICNECGVGINNYTPQTESTGPPIGDYRDGVGAWQTERMTEEEVDTMLAKVLVGQTDCGWRRPDE